MFLYNGRLHGVWRQIYSIGLRSFSFEAKKPWRDAASLIVAVPALRTKGSYSTDYKILYLKRAAKSNFYPNAYVYPGGVIDEADKSLKWIEIFSRFDPLFCENISKEFFVQQNDGKRLPLFPGDETLIKKGVLPNEIAFRICAIRESFEESGVLLLTDDIEARHDSPDKILAKSVTSLLSERDAILWRKRIHNDASEFINLCQELEKVPDVWSLKEWFEWFSSEYPGKKLRRYDTIFYSCCLSEAPHSEHDKVEMAESMWISPADMIRLFIKEKAILGPPQVLETLKLLNFGTLDSLSSYMNGRAHRGLRLWMPDFTTTKDGKMIAIMPGDDRYRKGIDLYHKTLEPSISDVTHSELISLPGNQCNFPPDGYPPVERLSTMMCNTTFDYGLVSPVVIRNPKKFLEN